MANEISYNEEPSEIGTEARAPLLQSPFCGELRSKKFYMRNSIATEASHYIDASNHCWCFETQLVVGPDGDHVDPHACVPGRSCYKSALG
jgi:hypothetical protein